MTLKTLEKIPGKMLLSIALVQASICFFSATTVAAPSPIATTTCPSSFNGHDLRGDLAAPPQVADAGKGSYFEFTCYYGDAGPVPGSNPPSNATVGSIVISWAESGEGIECRSAPHTLSLDDMTYVFSPTHRMTAQVTSKDQATHAAMVTGADREFDGIRDYAARCDRSERATLKLKVVAHKRYGADMDRDGVTDSMNSKRKAQPRKLWFTANVRRGNTRKCPSTRRYRYLFSINGDAVGAQRIKNCKFQFKVSKEGVFRLRLDVARRKANGTVGDNIAWGAVDPFVVQDWLIVGLGDSLASGEGAPDIPADSGAKPPRKVRWQNERCHRSAKSHQAQFAADLEHIDNRTSVTFVHLACSGASISTGTTGEYWGMEPGESPVPLESQVAALRKIVGGREIDALMVNVGVNEFRFGDIISSCVKQLSCQDHFWEGTTPLSTWVDQRFATLDNLFAVFASQLAGGLGVPPGRVYQTQYPNEVHDSNGNQCGSLVYLLPGLEVDGSETWWLERRLLLPLNDYIAQNKSKLGWNIVADSTGWFHTHGYCTADDHRWVVTYDDSTAAQGNSNGTLHPNEKGHTHLAGIVQQTIVPDFYSAGDMISGTPRAPS